MIKNKQYEKDKISQINKIKCQMNYILNRSLGYTLLLLVQILAASKVIVHSYILDSILYFWTNSRKIISLLSFSNARLQLDYPFDGLWLRACRVFLFLLLR